MRKTIICAAMAAASAVAATYRVDLDRPDGIYRCGETATFSVRLLEKKNLAEVERPFAVIDNFGTTALTNMPFDVSATGVVFKVSGTLREPGFLRLSLPPTKNGRGDPFVFSAGFEPEKIRKGSPSPKDFDAFWSDARARLAREVPLDAQIVRVAERSTKAFDFYRISFATFGRRVHGYMSVPTDKSKAPFAVDLEVNAAGFGDWTNDMKGSKDAISVRFSVYPFAPDWKWRKSGLEAKYKEMDASLAARFGAPRYCQAGITESREDYFFYPVILGIDRAVDWVAARPDVDRSRFRYQGTSQGGGFGFYLCGLNHTFTHAAFYVPAITDTMGYLKGRQSGWPQVVENNSSTPARRAAAERWAPYFDGANFASRITCPVRVAVGFSDTTCPPCAVYAAYNEIRVKDKAIGNGIGMTHSCRRQFYSQFGNWVKSHKRQLAPFEVDVSFASAVLPIEEWLPVTFGQTKGGTYRLDGKFLDARIYSRALSDAEAAAYSKAAAGAVSIAREGLVWEGVPTPGDRCDAMKKADYSNGFTFACRVILNKTGGRLIDNTTGGCDGWLIDTWPDRPRFYCCGKRVGDHKRQFAIGRAQSLVATLKDGKTSIWLDGERCDYSFDPSILRRTTWNDLVEKKAKPLEWIFPTGDETPQEGMRFADGVTGVLAWGGGDTVKLTVGRADLWDHRGGYGWTKEQSYTNITDAIVKGDKARLLGLFKKETPPGEPRNPYILPLGRVELKIPGATLLRGALDVKTGVGTIDFLLGGATNRAELAMSKESHAFAIKLPEGTKCEAKAVHCMEQPAVKSALDKLSFKPAKYSANGFTWELPADESVTLAYVLKGGELSIATWRGDSVGASVPLARGHAGRVTLPNVTYSQIRAESTAHWTKFWAEGARVKVPDPVLQGLFDYGMYCFGCMTDPDGVPCGLQGAWLEDNYIAPWSADYHFNINVQECYSPAYRGGHFANMMPLFRMVLGWKPLLRDNARKFADVDGYVLPHSVSDRGVNIGGFWTGTIDHGSTAWVADMMFRYVKYSRDMDFLRRDAYDFMKGAMRVYRAMMVEDGKGGLAFPTGPSPEWGGATFETAVGRNPSFQLAAAHRLARNLIAAAALLGESPDPMWLDVEKRLPLAAIDNEKGGIMLFENRPFSASHRHHSHLAGLFPFDIFDLADPATAATVKKTYETWDARGTVAWTGWCVPWAAVLNVHAGRPAQAVKLLHDFDEYFTNPGHAPRCYAWKPGFCQFVSSTPKLGKDGRHLGHEVLDMDGLLSACAAVMEMMAHDVNGKTEFFRGCPDEWKDVSFENIALSDGRRVSGRRVNGKVEITAP